MIAAVPSPSAPPIERALPSPGRRDAVRRVAQATLAAALGELSGLAVAAAPAAAGARTARTLAAFCDTIVPADELTPAASALGVPEAIRAGMQGHALAERLLLAGCAWLDEATGGDFAAAAEPDRVAACERMQSMSWESPPGRFFALLRNTIMATYYADRRAWRGLALDRPPQPLGFFASVR
jgi:hypothetical protein